MVSSYELLLLAVAPSVFLLWFFRHKERFIREPIGLMIKVFILGAIWVIPAIIFEIIGDRLLHPNNGLIETILFLFVFVGPGEEFGKYWLGYAGLAISSILHATYDSTSAIAAAYSSDIVSLDLLGLIALAGIVYLSYIVIVRREIGTAEAEEDHPPNTG